EDAGDEPAMLADLLAPPPEVRDDPDLAIERVRNNATLGAYRDVLSRGFGEGAREAEWVASVFGSIGLGDDPAWRHYVGRINGAAVSTVSLLVDSGVGGIYFVCTAPDARRRGLGAAITRHAMVEARALGCAVAVLGASS